MIITRTPVRISFLGGGTDYPTSIKQWGGMVLGSTINKYSYITCRVLPKFFSYHSRVVYSKIETVNSNDDIEHRVIKAAVKRCGLSKVPLEISHMSDFPSQSGTGSSSTFTVGLINALSLLNQEQLNAYELYESAIDIEQNVLKENVGCQDQAWAAFGGMNVIKFLPDGGIRVSPIMKTEVELRRLSNNLLLFFTGIHRVSSTVAGTYVPTLSDKASEHKELLNLTRRGVEALERGKYDSLGELLNESWEIKKSFSKAVTCSEIDGMYKTALEAGALGGKLMGAGGGGCMLLYTPISRREKVLDAIKALHINYAFEPKGSTVLYVN